VIRREPARDEQCLPAFVRAQRGVLAPLRSAIARAPSGAAAGQLLLRKPLRSTAEAPRSRSCGNKQAGDQAGDRQHDEHLEQREALLTAEIELAEDGAWLWPDGREGAAARRMAYQLPRSLASPVPPSALSEPSE